MFMIGNMFMIVFARAPVLPKCGASCLAPHVSSLNLLQIDPGKSWEPPIMINGHEVYRGTLQSLASVDLGEESTAEALMDPSHPSVCTIATLPRLRSCIRVRGPSHLALDMIRWGALLL